MCFAWWYARRLGLPTVCVYIYFIMSLRERMQYMACCVHLIEYTPGKLSRLSQSIFEQVNSLDCIPHNNHSKQYQRNKRCGYPRAQALIQP